MRITLHIGMHKTGTTSVQAHLRHHEDSMARQGITSSIHLMDLVQSRAGNYDPDAVRHRFRALSKAGTQHLVLSSEVYSTLDNADFASLWACLQDHPVTLVLCIRHWSTFLPSRWQQNAKRRDADSFRRFLSRSKAEGHTRFDMRYDRILDAFDPAGFDTVRIVSFDNAIARDGIYQTLLRAMDLEHTLEAQGPQRHANPRKSNAFVDKIRLFNGVFAASRGMSTASMFEDFGAQRPLGVQFDFQFCSDTLFKAMGDADVALNQLIAQTQNTTHLYPGLFTEYAEPVEAAVAPYLFNPIDGMAFPAPRNVTVQSSTLEYADLPAPLRDRMLQAIDATGTMTDTGFVAHAG